MKGLLATQRFRVLRKKDICVFIEQCGADKRTGSLSSRQLFGNTYSDYPAHGRVLRIRMMVCLVLYRVHRVRKQQPL